MEAFFVTEKGIKYISASRHLDLSSRRLGIKPEDSKRFHERRLERWTEGAHRIEIRTSCLVDYMLDASAGGAETCVFLLRKVRKRSLECTTQVSTKKLKGKRRNQNGVAQTGTQCGRRADQRLLDHAGKQTRLECDAPYGTLLALSFSYSLIRRSVVVRIRYEYGADIPSGVINADIIQHFYRYNATLLYSSQLCDVCGEMGKHIARMIGMSVLHVFMFPPGG